MKPMMCLQWKYSRPPVQTSVQVVCLFIQPLKVSSLDKKKASVSVLQIHLTLHDKVPI